MNKWIKFLAEQESVGMADAPVIDSADKEKEKPSSGVLPPPNKSTAPAERKPLQGCQPIKGVTDEQKKKYAELAQSFIASKVPSRIACEISYVKIRPQYANKAFFVVDTLSNLIYLFSKEGKFVSRAATIDGKHAQTMNAKSLAAATDPLKSMGYAADRTGALVDKAGKKVNIDADAGAFYKHLDTSGARFWPQGVYPITLAYRTEGYVSNAGDNIYRSGDIGQAIHGTPGRKSSRDELMSKFGKMVGKEDEQGASEEFQDYINKNRGTEAGGNMSYGCINVPPYFLDKMKKHGVGAIVFVMGEGENYLVNNSKEFFLNSDKSQNLEQYVASAVKTELPRVSPTSFSSQMA